MRMINKSPQNVSTISNLYPPLSLSEWRWALLWASLIMLITSVPYIYGFSLSSPQQQFSGFVIGVEDMNSYLAKMRLGSEGGWLFYLPYTAEPHQGAYIYGFYLLLGKVTHLSNLSAVLIYHLARLIFGLGLLLTIYYFVAYFLADIQQRRFAFLLVGLGSGLGWLLTLLGLIPRLGLPLDLYVPEGFVFLVLLHLPHLALAESLLLLAMLLVLQSWQNQGWKRSLWAGSALLGMSIIATFYLAVFVAVLGLTWLWLWLTHRLKISVWPALVKIVLPVIIAFPISAYYAYVFATNPIFGAWGQQNKVLSPPVWHYLFAYGLLALPAIYGGWLLHRLSSQSGPVFAPHKAWFLILWALIFPILVYIPFNLQRRFVVGAQLPLAILATYALFTLVKRWRPSQKTGLTFGNLLLGSSLVFYSLTNLFILVGSIITIRSQHPPIFQTQAQLMAMRWLAQQTTGEIVLSSHESGNVLPVYANIRTFVGHGSETVNVEEKRTQVHTFFNQDTADAWRIDLLKQFQIRYLYYGRTEKVEGGFDPNEAEYLEVVYDQGGVQIFRFDEATPKN